MFEPADGTDSLYYAKILADFGFATGVYQLHKFKAIPVFTRPNFAGPDTQNHAAGVTVRKWKDMCGEISAKIPDPKSDKTFLIEIMLSQRSLDKLTERECLHPPNGRRKTVKTETVNLRKSYYDYIGSLEKEDDRLDAWIAYLIQIALYRNAHWYYLEPGSFWKYYSTSIPHDESNGLNFFQFHAPLMVAVTVIEAAPGPGGFRDASNYVPGRFSAT